MPSARYLTSLGRCVLYMTNQVYKVPNYKFGDFSMNRRDMTKYKDDYLDNFINHPDKKNINEQFNNFYSQIKENPYHDDKEFNSELDNFMKDFNKKI